MANTTNVAVIQTANTFDHWRIRDNLVANDVNEIARGEFYKVRGSITVNEGSLTMANTSGGVILTVKDDARIDGLLSVDSIETDSDGFVYINAGDITMSNRAAGGLFQANINTKFDSANVEFSNSNIHFTNASSNAIVRIRPNTSFLNNVTVNGTLNVASNANFNGTTTNVSGNLIATGQTVNVSGNAIIDTGTFFVDSQSNKISINSGVDTPEADLEIVGNNKVTTNLTVGTFASIGTSANVPTVNTATVVAAANTLTLSGGGGSIGTPNGNVIFVSGGTETVRITNTSRVGVNTTTPNSTLSVVGNVWVTTGINVATANVQTLNVSNVTITNAQISVATVSNQLNAVSANIITANVANQTVSATLNVATGNITTLAVTSLSVTNPIAAPAETDSDFYRLRVNQTTRGSGSFGVRLGSAANGNAFITFDTAAGNVWRLTANSTEGTYRTILTTQNVIDSVTSTSTTDAGAPNAVKTAYDQATSARDQANNARLDANTTFATINTTFGTLNTNITTANTQANAARDQANSARTQANTAYAQANAAFNAANNAQVTVFQNSASSITTQRINFINTATITVAVANDGGNANVAFTAVGGAAYDQANAAYGQANSSANAARVIHANTNATFNNTTITVSNSASINVRTASGSGASNTVFFFEANTSNPAALGPQGFQGVQGAVGSPGPQGFQGPTGAPGAQGVQGAIGSPGPQGFQGVQGPTGAPGAQGVQGPTGAPGAQGVQGRQGVAGGPGPQGFQGVAGGPGPQGFQGVAGGPGAQGVQGSTGAPGAQGPAGGFTTNSNAQVNSLGVGTGASGTAGEIRATGDIIAYFSDMRLKKFLGQIEDALVKLNGIQGFYYTGNEEAGRLGYNTEKREVGVSAQDVQNVLPEIIKSAPIDEQYMTLDYARIVPLLIEAVKELNKKVDNLRENLRKV